MKSALIKELKSTCLPRLVELCDGAGLTEVQKQIIIHRLNKGHGVLRVSLDLNMCETVVKTRFSVALDRIDDYKKYLQIEKK